MSGNVFLLLCVSLTVFIARACVFEFEYIFVCVFECTKINEPKSSHIFVKLQLIHFQSKSEQVKHAVSLPLCYHLACEESHTKWFHSLLFLKFRAAFSRVVPNCFWF